MKELSRELYLTRREFLKAVGIGATALSTGCLEPVREFYLKKKDTDGDGGSDFDEVRRGSDHGFNSLKIDFITLN